MAHLSPMTELPTHAVTNQAPAFEGVNLWSSDAALRDATEREGGAWAADRLQAFGARVGSAEVIEWGFEANRERPQLLTFDRYGQRIDEVRYHPSYHALMTLAVEAGMHSVAWTAERGGHVAHAAFEYLMAQAEPGVCCPLSMTYAVVPALRHQPELAQEWEPKLTAQTYDPRSCPSEQKSGVTMGMAMTEKQGGSDVRANTTLAHPLGDGGPGASYELVGHKWFCSAPMSDAFLTLAQAPGGLSCFLVPRWRPDKTRNPFFIQRLKDKLGDHANASSEIEYAGTFARMVGEEGRGVRTIIEMVQHTRLDCIVSPAAMMRQAVANACWHTAHRSAFGKVLIEQPLMRAVLADLVLESEAATALAMRIARSFDDSAGQDPEPARLLARLATPVTKYWLNKRLPELVYEAMECHGGAGFIEESVMPRLFRQSPLNSIWEGSGNVICLDVLRAMGREPACVEALVGEIRAGVGGDRRFDAFVETLADRLTKPIAQGDARRVCELLGLALQGSLLVRHGPSFVADAFCAGRLGDEGRCYGTLPAGVDLDALIERGRPQDRA
ncbi:putative acyl-CoA dehydrogenase AidB [Enhygromyxa salina]|uniref:Putative acyl-CoA dehydrogenase AidB n=1 Tax=Enhygromyxa salina TaxID=215803 RepID=A0A2S9XV15_9BACT|nr:acyl-CoA dehydrogenase family protein [Enhygromyxa salina]PRP96580.1 putative acyl-CoA dehydrogenase AidB [Enhygromyxa salina]